MGHDNGRFVVEAETSQFIVWLTDRVTQIMAEGVKLLDPDKLETTFQELDDHRCWTHFLPLDEMEAMRQNHYDWAAYWGFWNQPRYWIHCHPSQLYQVETSDSDVKLYTTLTGALTVHRGYTNGARKLTNPCVRFRAAPLSKTKTKLKIWYDEDPFSRYNWPGHSLISPQDYFLNALAISLQTFNLVAANSDGHLEKYLVGQRNGASLNYTPEEKALIIGEWLEIERKAKAEFCTEYGILPEVLQEWVTSFAG